MLCWECGHKCGDEKDIGEDSRCTNCKNLLFPILRKGVESYAEAHSTPESTILQELKHETETKLEGGQMLIGRCEGGFLKMLVWMSRAKRILEIGTYTGYSALFMAEALPEDGKLMAVDNFSDESKSEEILLKYLKLSPHGKKIELRKQTGLEFLKEKHEPFDLIFIDADKETQIQYYEQVLAKQLLSERGILAFDNTLWGGLVKEQKKNQITADIHDFNEHIAKDSRTEKLLLTLRDGLTLIRLKPSTQ